VVVVVVVVVFVFLGLVRRLLSRGQRVVVPGTIDETRFLVPFP
jgi:hypothetical protein